jgi:hypothetical protein
MLDDIPALASADREALLTASAGSIPGDASPANRVLAPIMLRGRVIGPAACKMAGRVPNAS